MNKMESTRKPAVAGTFYPAEAHVLATLIDELFAQADDGQDRCPKVIIAPHAGYIYSGPIAATAYHCLQACHDRFKRVVLLGPSHRVAFTGLALCSRQNYQTPLGDIKLDIAGSQALLDLEFVSVLDDAHTNEHSLEVHLPFLQSTLDDFSLIPIVVGDARAQDIAQLLEMFDDDDDTMIVISTDLSHFHDYATAQQRDSATVNAMLEYRYNDINYEDACGRNPVNGVLHWAKHHHYPIELLDLRNSGDTAGDKNRVVGYAALHIFQNAD